jgi:phage shock protein C
MQHVYRSKENKIWAGVLGGVGEYFDVDPTLLRLLWLLLVVATGILPGIIVYIIAVFVVPKRK